MTQELIDVDGRTVVIVNKVPELKEYKLFKKVILNFCSKYSLAKLFPEIMVVLESKEEIEKVGMLEHEGWVESKELIVGVFIIYLNPILSLSKGELSIYETLIHELTHIWHERETKLLSVLYKTRKKL